jgi:hypothetical protein
LSHAGNFEEIRDPRRIHEIRVPEIGIVSDRGRAHGPRISRFRRPVRGRLKLDEEIAPMAFAARLAPNGFNGRLKVDIDPLEDRPLRLRIVPVLPQEDPATLEDRIDRFIEDMQPRTAVEAELVTQAARLTWTIERADRLENAHLAALVRKAELRDGRASARQFQRAEELGRKLESGEVPSLPSPWVDQPAVFLRGLEETEDGCRWLLKRWAEFRNLLERRVNWMLTDLFRFVRLQGKHAVEAVNDPELNVFFLAWDVIWPGVAKAFWEGSRGRTPDRDPGLNAAMEWREIADRPSDKDQAWAVLRAEVNERIAQLSSTLGEFARVASADSADRAALDCSPGLARHRGHRLAMGRELLRIMDVLRKSSSAKQMASGQCPTADEKWARTNGKCRMPEGKAEAAEKCDGTNGKCGKDVMQNGGGTFTRRIPNTSGGNQPDNSGAIHPAGAECLTTGQPTIAEGEGSS